MTPDELINAVALLGGAAKVEPLPPAQGSQIRQIRLVPVGAPWIAAQGSQLRALTGNYGPAGAVPLDGPLRGGQITEQTMTLEEWWARQITAAAVILAGSAGNPRARRLRGASGAGPNVPAGGAVSTPNLPASSVLCRGLWQLNSREYSAITDAAAYDPKSATAVAALLTDGWRDWSAWRGSPGLDPASEHHAQAKAALEATLGTVIDKGIFGIPGEAAFLDTAQSIVGNVAAPLLGWAEALGRLLSHLLDAGWWRRLGVGATGVLLVVLATRLYR